MKKYTVTRTYSMKAFTEQVSVEAETPEAASAAASSELDAKEDELESNFSFSELMDQEEVEEN